MAHQLLRLNNKHTYIHLHKTKSSAFSKSTFSLAHHCHYGQMLDIVTATAIYIAFYIEGLKTSPIGLEDIKSTEGVSF